MDKDKKYYVKLRRTGEVVVKSHNEAMDMINQGEGLVVGTVGDEVTNTPKPEVVVKEVGENAVEEVVEEVEEVVEEEVAVEMPEPEPKPVKAKEKPRKKRGRKTKS